MMRERQSVSLPPCPWPVPRAPAPSPLSSLQQISSIANDPATLTAAGRSYETTLAHRTGCVRAS
eukprot:343511-Prymnesium_polylepis.1